jgi:hypothetical protein
MTDFSRYHIYCDESSTQHRYTVIGAAFCHETLAERIELAVEDTITPYGGTSELKWSKVKRKNLPMYTDVSRLFFSLNKLQMLHYYCLVIDNSKMDHETYNEGDKEIGFNKMIFTLLYKFARTYRSNSLFYVYLDDRTTAHTPENMRRMLNARVDRDLRLGYQPYRVCQFRKSHESRLIQITDIITGAIAYATNRHDLKSTAASHKITLVETITKLSGRPALSIPTPYGSAGFDIWHIDFSRRKRVPRA